MLGKMNGEPTTKLMTLGELGRAVSNCVHISPWCPSLSWWFPIEYEVGVLLGVDESLLRWEEDGWHCHNPWLLRDDHVHVAEIGCTAHAEMMWYVEGMTIDGCVCFWHMMDVWLVHVPVSPWYHHVFHPIILIPIRWHRPFLYMHTYIYTDRQTYTYIHTHTHAQIHTTHTWWLSSYLCSWSALLCSNVRV